MPCSWDSKGDNGRPAGESGEAQYLQINQNAKPPLAPDSPIIPATIKIALDPIRMIPRLVIKSKPAGHSNSLMKEKMLTGTAPIKKDVISTDHQRIARNHHPIMKAGIPRKSKCAKAIGNGNITLINPQNATFRKNSINRESNSGKLTAVDINITPIVKNKMTGTNAVDRRATIVLANIVFITSDIVYLLMAERLTACVTGGWESQPTKRDQVPRLNQAQSAEPTSRPVHAVLALL